MHSSRVLLAMVRFILKHYAPTELVEAIRTVVDDGTCVPSGIAV